MLNTPRAFGKAHEIQVHQCRGRKLKRSLLLCIEVGAVSSKGNGLAIFAAQFVRTLLGSWFKTNATRFESH